MSSAFVSGVSTSTPLPEALLEAALRPRRSSRRRRRRSRSSRRTPAACPSPSRAASSGIAANPCPPNSKPLENWKRPTTSKRRSPSGVASSMRSPTLDVVRVRPAVLERDLEPALSGSRPATSRSRSRPRARGPVRRRSAASSASRRAPSRRPRPGVKMLEDPCPTASSTPGVRLDLLERRCPEASPRPLPETTRSARP